MLCSNYSHNIVQEKEQIKKICYDSKQFNFGVKIKDKLKNAVLTI